MVRRAMTVLALLVAAGCGNEASGAGDDGELTSRAIAAVMLDHLPKDTSRREATYEDEHSPEGFVGADLRYNGGEGDDGDLVSVTLQQATRLPECQTRTCVDVGDGVRLDWDLVEPEEDPGIVDLSTVRHGALVNVHLSGPEITGDPRTTLEETYAQMLALVRDERLRLDPDAATVQAGEVVTGWKGGERDPRDLEQVPNDDQTVVTEFIWGWGDDWSYVGPSPSRKLFGEDAIGGRAMVGTEGFEPVAPGFIDALAAPQPPAWLETCLPAYTCKRTGDDTFAWRPASGTDPGDAWMVHVRDGGETVALHTVGRRLPAKEKKAREVAGFSMWGNDFFDREEPLSVGLTTTRESYQQAKARLSGADR